MITLCVGKIILFYKFRTWTGLCNLQMCVMWTGFLFFLRGEKRQNKFPLSLYLPVFKESFIYQSVYCQSLTYQSSFWITACLVANSKYMKSRRFHGNSLSSYIKIKAPARRNLGTGGGYTPWVYYPARTYRSVRVGITPVFYIHYYAYLLFISW